MMRKVEPLSTVQEAAWRARVEGCPLRVGGVVPARESWWKMLNDCCMSTRTSRFPRLSRKPCSS